MKVGTREFKNRLSYYLRRVREGEVLYVSDRDVVIAEVKSFPPSSRKKKKKSDRELLASLAARGDVTMGTGAFEPFEPLKLGGGKPLSKMILEDRR